MMKSEQRATRDETRDLAMPRQGVSLLNVMLDEAAMRQKKTGIRVTLPVRLNSEPFYEGVYYGTDRKSTF